MATTSIVAITDRLTSPIVREKQLKTIVRYLLMPFRKAIIKNPTGNKYWQGCGKKGTLVHC